MDKIMSDSITNLFLMMYYDEPDRTWKNTRWLGVPTQKNPFDLWVYQEILFEQKPDLIIETGTADGGSALYLASICDLIGHGEIITIDIEHKPERPVHPRITYMHASSTSKETSQTMRKQASGVPKVLVILDSDHSAAHVLDELNIYSDLVTKGSYLIVEDSCVYGHPLLIEHGPGPMEAMEQFSKTDKRYAVDESREKFFMTFNPKGFLRREK